jgi:hypothetical protein
LRLEGVSFVVLRHALSHTLSTTHIQPREYRHNLLVELFHLLSSSKLRESVVVRKGGGGGGTIMVVHSSHIHRVRPGAKSVQTVIL